MHVSRRTMALRRLAPAGAATLALCVAASPAIAGSARWNGALDREPIVKLSFQYNGSRVTNFKIPYILCSAGVNGTESEMMYVPSIPVHRGHFATTFHVLKNNPKVLIKVSGTIRGSRVSGTVSGQGVCETGLQPFHANQGAFKPVAPPKAKGSCTMAGCLASNGMFITVTGVDRSIRSVEQPQGSIMIPADPAYQNGAVSVTVTEQDRSVRGPARVDPAGDFQLRLGSGVLSPGGGPDGEAVNGSGAEYPCAQIGIDNPLYEATLTQGASFGPLSVCFGAPTPADRQNLTLYYEPGGSLAPVDAKIPLG